MPLQKLNAPSACCAGMRSTVGLTIWSGGWQMCAACPVADSDRRSFESGSLATRRRWVMLPSLILRGVPSWIDSMTLVQRHLTDWRRTLANQASAVDAPIASLSDAVRPGRRATDRHR